MYIPCNLYIHAYVSFLYRYYIMCIVSLNPALLPMAPCLGVLLVSLSCLRMLEAPPAHQVPTSSSAGQVVIGSLDWRESLQPNLAEGKQLLCIGYLWMFGSWFCNLGSFCCSVVVWSPSFLVFNTFSTYRTCRGARNLRRLSSQASWWEGLLMFFVYLKILKGDTPDGA